MKEKVILIEGMMCKHCVKHVTDALSKIEGVKSVDVSLEKKTATIKCGDTVSDNLIKSVITEEGYEVTDIK